MTKMQWGRLQADVNCRLRRGAWYRVLRVAPLEAVVEVNRRPLPVPRYLIEIVSQPPRRWTVVPAPRAARQVAAHLGDAYLVCPSCRGRAPLRGRPRRAPCERCRTDFEVAWEEAYLEGP
ncbi:MAG TPA: hypothetical protein VNI61_01635 [Gemmatimonadales bacterium]|nr:hypothetical protein [Gemmatimonadales bacterium]